MTSAQHIVSLLVSPDDETAHAGNALLLQNPDLEPEVFAANSSIWRSPKGLLVALSRLGQKRGLTPAALFGWAEENLTRAEPLLDRIAPGHPGIRRQVQVAFQETLDEPEQAVLLKFELTLTERLVAETGPESPVHPALRRLIHKVRNIHNLVVSNKEFIDFTTDPIQRAEAWEDILLCQEDILECWIPLALLTLCAHADTLPEVPREALLRWQRDTLRERLCGPG